MLNYTILTHLHPLLSTFFHFVDNFLPQKRSRLRNRDPVKGHIIILSMLLSSVITEKNELTLPPCAEHRAGLTPFLSTT